MPTYCQYLHLTYTLPTAYRLPTYLGARGGLGPTVAAARVPTSAPQRQAKPSQAKPAKGAADGAASASPARGGARSLGHARYARAAPRQLSGIHATQRRGGRARGVASCTRVGAAARLGPARARYAGGAGELRTCTSARARAAPIAAWRGAAALPWPGPRAGSQRGGAPARRAGAPVRRGARRPVGLLLGFTPRWSGAAMDK